MPRSAKTSVISAVLEGGGEGARGGVVEQHANRLRGIGLGIANEPHRSALNPSSGVKARHHFTGLINDMATVIIDDVLVLIKRHAIDRIGAVAGGEVDRLYRPFGEFSGAVHAAIAVERGSLGLDAGNLAVLAQDLYRLLKEVDLQGVRRLFGIADGVLLKDLAYQVGGLAFLTRGERSFVIVNVFR